MLLTCLVGAVGGAHAEEGDDPLHIGRSPPNVVRAVELVLDGNAPTVIDPQRDWEARHDDIGAWWTSIGRRAVPALLRALDPARPDYVSGRRRRALEGLTYLVRTWDLPLLRELHERGWRDVFWLQVLLEDRHIPRHTRIALERGSRGGIVEIAALSHPHRLIDESVLCIVAEGSKEIGDGDTWFPTYIDRRRLTEAIPALERWIAELERGRPSDALVDGEDPLVPGLGQPLPDELEEMLREPPDLEVPPGLSWRQPRAWTVSRRIRDGDAWVEYVGDLILELQVVCARLGSHHALQALVDTARPDSERPPACPWVLDDYVRESAIEALGHLLEAPLPESEDAAQALFAWCEQHKARLRFDPDSRTWGVD